MAQQVDLTGQKFGKLTVIRYAGTKNKAKRNRHYWECLCDCGNTKEIDGDKLRFGHTVSCGCKLKEIRQSVGKICYKNGLSGTRISRIYWNMINRCYYEKFRTFKYYGGRGIKVCEDWLSTNNGFSNFCNWSMTNGYNENLTLDRIDYNGNYEPSNCRWTTMYEQGNNKRNNVFLKINGDIDTVGNWARKLQISYKNLYHYAKGGKNCKYPNLLIEAIYD